METIGLKNISVNNNLVDADVDTLNTNHTKYLHPAAATSPEYKKDGCWDVANWNS